MFCFERKKIKKKKKWPRIEWLLYLFLRASCFCLEVLEDLRHELPAVVLGLEDGQRLHLDQDVGRRFVVGSLQKYVFFIYVLLYPSSLEGLSYELLSNTYSLTS